MRKLLTEQLVAKGIAAPELPDRPPFYADPPLELDLIVAQSLAHHRSQQLA